MAINFIRNIAENKIDENTHHMFTRYGNGEYEKEEFKVKKSKKNIKIWAGFEYTNAMLKFVANLCSDSEKIKVKGVIITQEDLTGVLEKNKIEFTSKDKRGMRGMKKTEYSIEGEFDKKELLKLIDQLYKFYLFLDIKQENREYKVKKKAVPKIGKETDKFVNATLELEDEEKLKEEFLFDVTGDFKEVSIFHTYKIDNVKVDNKLLEKDSLKARLEAKREGKLLRKLIVDGQETVKEYSLDV
jgi:hypothetical protein